MLRYLPALVLAAVLAAASCSDVDARVVHPEVLGDKGRLLDSTKEVTGICQQMHYKTLCSTLTTLPGVTTPQQLLDAALKVAASKAALAEERLGEALKSPKAKGTPMSSSLEACKDSYASLVDSLGSARKTLKGGGSHGDLMSELSAASTFSTDCDDIFDERPELKSPIPGAQRHVSRLVANCLDLAATITQN